MGRRKLTQEEKLTRKLHRLQLEINSIERQLLAKPVSDDVQTSTEIREE
jgi:hypothetical protein